MASPLGSPLRLLAHARLPAWSARACAAAPLCGSVLALRRARPARPPAAGRLLTQRSSTGLDSPLLPLLILQLSDLSFDYCPDVGYLLHVGLIVRIVSFRGAAPMVAVRAVVAAAVGSDQRTISGKFAKLKEQGKHRRFLMRANGPENKQPQSESGIEPCDTEDKQLSLSFSHSRQLQSVVEGMDVGISMEMNNQNGSLKLFVMECGCHVKDLDITLNGGASLFYQGFIDAFSNHIISSVENAITNKIMVGASKLDSFLGSLPKKIDVDNVAAMNVTFVNDPLFKSSSVEFDIYGLFIPSHKTALPRNRLFGDTKFTPPLVSTSKMLWISLDEDVFNSVSALYFKAGLLQRMVDKIPDQFLLNTATWRVFIPTLYHKYPDHDTVLNISAISPPSED